MDTEAVIAGDTSVTKHWYGGSEGESTLVGEGGLPGSHLSDAT